MADEASTLQVVHEAYCSLTHDQLAVFCRIRGLAETGSHHELASRLTYFDARTYQHGNKTAVVAVSAPSPPTFKAPIINGVIREHEYAIFGAPSSLPTPTVAPSISRTTSTVSVRAKRTPILDVPVELLADIMDHVGDWALARAVGVPTSISRPLDWAHASQTDEAMLTGYLPLIRAADPATHPPTKLGAKIAVRFGYVHVLEHFLLHHRTLLPRIFPGTLLPTTASQHGRIRVLLWWKRVREQYSGLLVTPSAAGIAEAVDAASRGGSVVALEWWYRSSRLPFEYTELSLESASGRGHIAVLDWWAARHREDGLPLKVGRAIDAASTSGRVNVLQWWLSSGLELKYDRQALHHASNHGKVDVLQWWADSGLQLIFDADALTGATRHNRPEVLEWWDKSGLPVPYRMCDIEEALEDAIGGGERAREWWRRKGVDFNANDKEWMKLQTLN